MSTTAEDIRIARLEAAGQLPQVCPWCCRAIADSEDEVVTDDAHDYDGTLHARCLFQRQDEDELCDFLDQIARDAAEKIKEYRSTHVSRVLEHHAGSLLHRLQAVIDTATR